MIKKKGRKSLFVKGKKGQIWVETIIYTLIAFALIGLVLAFIKPEIEEIQDRGFIEKSIDALSEIDSIISTIGGPGNQRVVRLGINKGLFEINGENDILLFEIESRYAYSEPGEEITEGNVIINTEEIGDVYTVTIKTNYTQRYNITYDGNDEIRRLTESPTPHSLLIINNGKDTENKTIINIETLN